MDLGSECYAFKNEKGCIELFEDHINGIIECLVKRWELRGLVKKLNKLYGLDEALIHGLIKISALLHDVGKAIHSFQKKCREDYCESFQYHYVISARLAIALGQRAGIMNNRLDEMLSIILMDREGDLLYSKRTSLGYLYLSIVVIPVLLHHYASVKAESLAHGFEETSKMLEIELDPTCRMKLKELLRELELPSALNGLRESLQSLLNSERIEIGLMRHDQIVRSGYERSFTKTLIEAVTGLLNICDGEVAARNRRCESSPA